MALEKRIPDQIGHCLAGQFGPVQCCTEDGLPGFRGADVTAHADRFVDDIRHPGLKTYPGEDTFCRGISHLDGCNDKIGFVLVFGDIASRARG